VSTPIIQPKVSKADLELFGLRLLEPADSSQTPRWPVTQTQLNYTGASGPELLRRTVDFVEAMYQNVPALETEHWRGLDYGVGWGRIASVMAYFGDPQLLDCADAWQKSLDLAKSCGLQNAMKLVPAVLGPGDLPSSTYDFIYSYSIFTHLPDTHIINNLTALVDALKPGGALIFTLREPKFIEFLQRSNKLSPVDDRLAKDGYWFGNAQNKDYGDTIVSPEWIDRHLGGLGQIFALGVLKSEPFQALMKITK
jgi:SAM-dependent methyltransferase